MLRGEKYPTLHATTPKFVLGPHNKELVLCTYKSTDQKAVLDFPVISFVSRSLLTTDQTLICLAHIRLVITKHAQHGADLMTLGVIPCSSSSAPATSPLVPMVWVLPDPVCPYAKTVAL